MSVNPQQYDAYWSMYNGQYEDGDIENFYPFCSIPITLYSTIVVSVHRVRVLLNNYHVLGIFKIMKSLLDYL
jgi:hypothetical protein